MYGAASIIVLILALVLKALVGPLTAQAPQDGKAWRIAIVSYPTVPTPPPPAPWFDALREALHDLGWTEGRNIVLERRSAELNRIDELAAQVVREGFDVVLTVATPMARAMKKATAVVPIVMVVASDPIRGGVVDNLRAPGANVTGHAIMGPELAGKRLELLKEVVPSLSLVALGLPGGRRREPVVVQYIDEYQAAARQLGLRFQVAEVGSAEEWDAAFARLRRAGVGAVAIPEGHTLLRQARQIVAAAIRHRVPTIHAFREDVEAGGLMSYGVDVVDLWRRSAVFVDKILRGTKPGDLPIEQPTKFELVINLKTAKALGLTIPPSLLLRADQVIE
jgi:putative ABC transport system substrate-binding protein